MATSVWRANWLAAAESSTRLPDTTPRRFALRGWSYSLGLLITGLVVVGPGRVAASRLACLG